MAKDHNHPDWQYFSYPFQSNVRYHPKAAIAFSGKKKGPRVYSHLMHAFVEGAPLHRASKWDLVVQKEGPQTSEEPELEPVQFDKRAVQDAIREFRACAFMDQLPLAHVLMRLAKASSFEELVWERFGDLFQFVAENGYFSGLEKTEMHRRHALWDQIQSCFLDCSRGLTVTKHRSKYSGYTSYEYYMVQWRQYAAFLELRGRNDDVSRDRFTEYVSWIRDNSDRITGLLDGMKADIGEKYKCKRCPMNFIGMVPIQAFEYISAYITGYRRTSPSNFFGIFISGLIFSCVRLETEHYIYNLSQAINNLPIWKESDFDDFGQLMSTSHNQHQLYVNSISWAIIDCLWQKKDG